MTAAFDTNILVYACDKDNRLRQSVALKLLTASGRGILFWQVACEYIAASRKLSYQGFTNEHAWNRLAELLKLHTLVTPTISNLERARDFHLRHRCALWDGLIYAACIEAGVDTLYSEDLPGCPVPGLNIVNPFAG